MKIIRDENGTRLFILPLLRKFDLPDECCLTDCESESKQVSCILIEDDNPLEVFVSPICENCYNKIRVNEKASFFYK